MKLHLFPISVPLTNGISQIFLNHLTRETREVWSLLTVETEVNGDLESTNESGFCSALAASVQVQNILFLTLHYFNPFVPIAQQAG
jgi:hypothetical protein